MRNHFPVTSRNLSGTITYSENSYFSRRKRAALELTTRDRARVSRKMLEIAQSIARAAVHLPTTRVAALRNIPFAAKLFPLFAYFHDERDKPRIVTNADDGKKIRCGKLAYDESLKIQKGDVTETKGGHGRSRTTILGVDAQNGKVTRRYKYLCSTYTNT